MEDKIFLLFLVLLPLFVIFAIVMTGMIINHRTCLREGKKDYIALLFANQQNNGGERE